jgi:hypothetical protein
MEEEQILFSLSKGCQANQDCPKSCPVFPPGYTEVDYLGETLCCPPGGKCEPGFSFSVNSRSGIYECYDLAPPELLNSGSIDLTRSDGGPEYFGAWQSINFATPEECGAAAAIAIAWYGSDEGRGCPDHDFGPCYFNNELQNKIHPVCCDGTCCQVGESCSPSYYVVTSIKYDDQGNPYDLTCSDTDQYPLLGPYRNICEAQDALQQLQGYNPDCAYALTTGAPYNCLSPDEIC